MDKKRVKDAFENLNPTEAQSLHMWERLNSEKAAEKKHLSVNKLRPAVTAAVIAIAVFFSGVGINAATGGELVSVIKELVGIKQSSQDVIGQAEEIQERGIEVWAPEIFGIDDQYVIFGTLRGIIAYDLKESVIAGTIDVQEIDCIYFNSDPKNTHVLYLGNELVLFNSESSKPFGSYYRYAVQSGDSEKIFLKESGNDAEQIQCYYELWLEAQNNYKDTFQQFAEHPEASAWIHGDKDSEPIMYGRRSLSWMDENNRKLRSFLTVKENQYVLRSYDETSDEFSETVLVMETAVKEETDLEEEILLPPFVYSGESPVIQAICEYFNEDALYYAERGELFIPAFIVLEEVETEDEYLVFGNFWYYAYLLNGNMLETSAGGEKPACFHLKKTEAGYAVTNVDTARDGSYYDKDIRAFTKDYPGVYEKFQNAYLEKDDARKWFMQMYVSDNELDVKCYKDYGWDPVEIFE